MTNNLQAYEPPTTNDSAMKALLRNCHAAQRVYVEKKKRQITDRVRQYRKGIRQTLRNRKSLNLTLAA